MRARSVMVLLMAVGIGVSGIAFGQEKGGRLPAGKKLIEYGWDVPTPAFVRDHIQEMETRPFDGVTMRLAGPGRGGVFRGGAWDEAAFEADFEALSGIEWNVFRDNFLMMYAASEMDWFSDSDWEAVTHNVRIMAKAARLGRCHITFDAEPYGANPWLYPRQAHAEERSFQEYQAVVRQRGAEFMEALQSEGRPFVLHTFFTFSYGVPLITPGDPDGLQDKLRDHHYGLYFSFLNGWLDAVDPDVTITDGNERSYYYQDSEAYFRAYHAMRQTAMQLVAPGNTTAFLTQTQAAQALYVDQLFDLRKRTFLSHFMTAEERAKWFEHNVYWAMTTADEFVWLYSERMNWWQNRVPDGLQEAVQSARAKVFAGTPLGFDLEPIIATARQRQDAEMARKLLTREATVAQVSAAPDIDGVADEEMWQKATLLEPFVPYVGAKDPPEVETRARLAYDDRALYVTVDCPEPDMAALQLTGSKRDDPIWMGDSIDIFVSAQPSGLPHVHVILSPRNVQWDARFAGENDVTWDGDWESAVHLGEDRWVAEVALPWKTLEIEPEKGMRLTGNICRQRRPVGEHTSWSQCVSGFMEHDHFGTWVLE